MDILPHGGAGFTRTQNVLIHRTDVHAGQSVGALQAASSSDVSKAIVHSSSSAWRRIASWWVNGATAAISIVVMVTIRLLWFEAGCA